MWASAFTPAITAGDPQTKIGTAPAGAEDAAKYAPVERSLGSFGDRNT